MSANAEKRLSDEGAAFIAGWEGEVLHPYNDPYNATIGVGHLIHLGPVTAADTRRYRGFTRQDARALLKGDVGDAEDAIREHIHSALNQNEWDAVVDLVFNCGPGVLDGSVGELINEGRFAAAGEAMQAWCHAGGVTLEGLVRRRAGDRELLLRPVPAYIPADEQRWEHEYDQLTHQKMTPRRRARERALHRAMTKRRKQIWHLGQTNHGKGWNDLNRSNRYRALLARTEG
jgi:lysozyme